MASRVMFSRVKFLGYVAFSELNFVRSPMLFGRQCMINASYATYSQKWKRNDDPMERTVSTRLIQNALGFRRFTLQHWHGIRASKLTVDNAKDNDENIGCPICRRNITFTYKDVLFLSQFMSPKGYILNRRVTGVCKKQQRKLEKAIRISQRLGVLPKLSPILIREMESQKQSQK